MRRTNRLFSLFLAQSLVLTLPVSASAAGGDQVWPPPPADPIVRFESALSRLANFEVAVQGPTGGPPRRVQKLKRPAGIAFDARGRLLVTDSRQGVLLQIDPDLGVALVFGTGTDPSLQEPMGVAVHPDGTIYVADAGLRRVVAFDGRGDVVAAFGDGGLEEPTDVALSPDGERLYVADTRANSVAVFDLASRRRLETFGSRGMGVGEFILPTAVEFDRLGNLLIVDQLNARVQIFDPDGAFTRAISFQDFSRPHDVAIDSAGRIYVTDRAQSLVQVYAADLDPLFDLGRNGLRDGEFLAIGGVAASGDHLAVLDHAGGRLQLFRLHGVEAQPAAVRGTPTAREAPVPAAPQRGAPLEATRLTDAGSDGDSGPASPSPPPTPAAEGSPEMTVEDLGDPMPEPEAEAPVSTEATGDGETRPSLEAAELVNAWAAAWSAQDADGYLDFYAESFQPEDGSSRDEWAAVRRKRVTGPVSIVIEIEIVETRQEGDTADIVLLQSYTSDRFADRVRKLLRLVPEESGWKIARETVLETL